MNSSLSNPTGRYLILSCVIALVFAACGGGESGETTSNVPTSEASSTSTTFTEPIPDHPAITVYGSEEGLPDGCAWRVAFTQSGTPLVGGPCGIYELSDGRLHLIADEEATGVALMDLAVDHDGGIWVGSFAQPLRRLMGDTVVEMEIGSPYVDVGQDGTIWAVDFPFMGGPGWPPTLISYAAGSWEDVGGASVDDGVSEGVGHPTVGPDGTVWVLIGIDLARVSGNGLEPIALDRPVPDFFLESPAPAHDGSIWVVAPTEQPVEKLGVIDELAYILHYDGSSTVSVEVPFAGISDLAVHPDGTVWASSIVHGVFSYDGEQWERYGIAEGMPSDEVDIIEIAPDGSIYAGTPQGLVHIRTKE